MSIVYKSTETVSSYDADGNEVGCVTHEIFTDGVKDFYKNGSILFVNDQNHLVLSSSFQDVMTGQVVTILEDKGVAEGDLIES